MLIVNSKMLYVMKIRTIVAVTALAAMALPVAAQHRCCHSVSVPDTVQCTRLQYYIDMQHQNKYTELWGQRATIFEALPVDTNDIVMLGISLTHGCEWHELLGMPNVLNRGIIGDVIEGIRLRVDPILNGHPKKIFLLAGVNDVSHNLSADSIANAMGAMVFGPVFAMLCAAVTDVLGYLIRPDGIYFLPFMRNLNMFWLVVQCE